MPDLPPIPRTRVMAYRRTATRPSVPEQVDGLLHDLACHSHLAEQGDPHARGAALAMAFAALRLAVTPAGTQRDRCQRDRALEEAVPVLARAGLGHVGGPVRAALGCEADPARLVPGAGAQQ